MGNLSNHLDTLEQDIFAPGSAEYNYDMAEFDRINGIDDEDTAELEAGLANVCEMMEAGLCPF